MKLNDETRKLFLEYLQEEPDEVLRSQIQYFDNHSGPGVLELEHRLNQHLKFGTAGIRGRMEAGYNRMNEVSVYRVAFAIGSCLLEKHSQATVVVAFDARHNSAKFAGEISQVLLKMGVSVKRFRQCIPTPLCAFATNYLAAEMGIMVTASHNPGADNGIKLFAAHGSQIVGPLLQSIEEKMSSAPLRSAFYSSAKYQGHDKPLFLEHDIEDAYFKAIKKTKLFNERDLDHDLAIAYTALHGVGYNYFVRALKNEGFCRVISVEEQKNPDGSFPTLIFPNPEEEHALDRAYALAKENRCPWVFANDPDADRIQIACDDGGGNFVKLSGNEMGSVLGYFAIKKALEEGKKPLVASSLVSSRMLETMAKKMGAYYVDGLTGFSNIAHAALKEEQKNSSNFVFAYEEAIGFLMRSVVLDKDGISAGARFMEIASWLAKRGSSVWQFIDELFLQFGIFVNCQWSHRYEGLAAESLMKIAMEKARALSEKEMEAFVGIVGCKKYDLRGTENKGPYSGIIANIIIFEIKNYFRFIIRPSGTEPKIKFYLELIDQVDDTAMLAKKKSETSVKLAFLKSIFEKIID